MHKSIVLIIDTDKKFIENLEKTMRQSGLYSHVTHTSDGRNGLDMTCSLQPDIVIVNVLMPNFDGVDYLNQLSKLKLQKVPIIFATCEIYSPTLIKVLISHDIAYFILKPQPFEFLCTIVSEFANMSQEDIERVEEKRNEEIKDIISCYLRKLYLLPSLKGFRYLSEAILYALYDTAPINKVLKHAYSKIAKKFNVHESTVNNAMKTAICSAWRNCPATYWGKMFGFSPSNRERICPTASEFIAISTNYLSVQYAEKIKNHI